MNKNRDNFSPAIIKILERRINGKCSNPDCRIVTSGPHVSPDKASNIGVAAHIKAAAAGGPRYDLTMTAKERSSINNAIWLCQNCSTLIDRNPEKYPVDLLARWKAESENLAETEYTKPAISRNDHDVIKGTLLGRLKKNQISTAVASVCRLTADAIEEIDSRFNAKISYNDNETRVTLSANEPISIDFVVNQNFKSEFIEKFDALINHGKDVEVNSTALKFKGSPLFDSLVGDDGKVFISTHARKIVIAKITIENTFGNVAFSFNDIIGELVGGKMSATFAGKTFDGLVVFKLSFPFTEKNGSVGDFDFSIDKTLWEGKSLSELSYFDKLYQFYEALEESTKIKLTIEIDGVEIITGEGSFATSSGSHKNSYMYLNYIRNARAILKILKMHAIYCVNHEIDFNNMVNAAYVYKMIFECSKLKGENIPVVEATMQIAPNIEEKMFGDLMMKIPHAIRFDWNLEKKLNIFGLLINSIPVTIFYSHAFLQIKDPKVKVKRGESYAFKIQPSKECHFLVEVLR